MADDIGGLFDSDPGFLEELASGTGEAVVQQQPQVGIPGMMAQNTGQMQQPNMQVMQQGYTNMNNMQNANYGNMQFQNQQQQQQAQQYNQSNFNQFNNQMFNQNTMVSQGHSQGHMNPMMSQQSQVMGNQFQPRNQGMMSPNQGMYQYNNPAMGGANPGVQRHPAQAQQQQQMKLQQQQQQMGWTQQQGQQPMFGQQPNQQSQQTPYLSQHDYAIPNAANQQAMQMQQAGAGQQPGFQAGQQPGQAMMMQRMTSPNRMPTNASQANMVGIPQQMYQTGNQPFSNMSQQGTMTSMAGMNGDPRMMQQQQKQQQHMMGQSPQQNPGQFQQFQYRSPPQGMVDGSGVNPQVSQQQPNMMQRFPQTSPTQQQQHRMPFNNMGQQQQRANAPILSPRPTPPPASPSVPPGMLSPTGSTSSQGGFNMDNTQQPSNNTNISIPFQQSANTPDCGIQKQTFNTGQLSQNSTQVISPPGNKTSGPPMGSMVSVNTSITNNPGQPGQVSPGYKVLSPNSRNVQQNVNIEIQTLNQQIQQLYNMPQTPQTQQKMLDLQEKLRILKSQQMMQNQRGKQPTFQTSIPQIQSMHPASSQNKMVQQGPMLTTATQMQAAQQQPGSKILVQTGANNTPGTQLFIIKPQQQNQMSQMSPQNPGQAGIPQQGQPMMSLVQGPGSLPQSVQSQPNMGTGQPQQMQNIVINTNHATGGKQFVIHSPGPSMPNMAGGEPVKMEQGTSQQQEKANKIIAEAIAKAQKSGNTSIPRVLEPPDLPSTLMEMDDSAANTSIITEPETKPKKKRRPRKDKAEAAAGENVDGEQKTPKRKRERKKKKADEPPEIPEANNITKMVEEVHDAFVPDLDSDASPLKAGSAVKKQKKPVGRPPKEKKKKSLPPATFLKSRKRKRRGSSDGSDVEIKITPPPSPENDDLKRRSGRVKRKKYLDDVDLNLSDEELNITTTETEGPIVKPVQLDVFVDNPAEEDAVIVDKILGARMRKKDADVDDDLEEEAEEYYVKYKNFSYLHCEWRTEAEIKDKRIQGKIRRYKIKKMQSINFEEDEEELFNPDYVEVDRVLEESHTIDPNTKEEVTHYLVKWRSLPYEDSTWELQQDVDPEKVKVFKKFNELPPPMYRRRKPRPNGPEWKALKETHTYKGGNTLREYQLEGVNWLTFNWYKGQNCILADEMGLGKTIQSITFLQEAFSYGIRGPFLVIAPLSTIANWQREFETWTEMNAITYHGTSPSRYMLQEYEMYYRDEEGGKITQYYKFHALITTYEVILSDLELLRSIDWRLIIIDEAHRLKNKNCSLIRCLRCFEFEHKVLLSGTPLQNNVEELFSLLNFLEPEQFHSSESFLLEFGTLKTEEQVDQLKAILKPMMLRRLKEDVEKNLAAKEETIIEVELTNIQKKYYRAILERNFQFLCKGASTGGNVPNLMNTMMELRKCCNHPYLINGAEENILNEMKNKEGKEPEHIEALIQASGKFVLLDKLLPKLKQNGNRVLIFSQMIRVLDIIEDYLINKRYLYERLDGRIRGNLRQEAIDRYSKPDSDRFIFLICTKAGGLGINLTAADTVVIYDSDWNPQNDLQAQARCHRIGQSKMVKVYRLITRNSYEREMFDRASMKLGLDKAVLQSMGGEKIQPQGPQLNKKEIEDLLRKGAYGALMEDDNAGDKFCEEDIDQILKGRTQVIQIESEGKGSTFAKASFSVSGNRDDIDINDPEFWQKWAKKADVDTENMGKAELIVDEPRVRKKTARYGNNDGVVDMSDLGSESDSDEDGSKKGGKKGRRGRRDDDDDDFAKERTPKVSSSGFGRSELFKVEKGLLHYGWGRWKDILAHSRFKRHMDEDDVEKCGKAILLYGLQYYKGDERIKEFISDLVNQSKDGTLKKHSGLSAPVPRGRKGRKAKNEENHFDANNEIEKLGIKIDRDILVNKNAYKRHIHRHANKVLLRVRSLYYLKHEVLGDNVLQQIDQGIHVKDIKNLADPVADGDLPAYWWDEIADKSLLIGVYKHGYEKFNMMRQDAQLIFLKRCGPPDDMALAAELKDDDDNENDDLDDKIESSMLEKEEEEESLSSAADAVSTPRRRASAAVIQDGEGEDGKLPFPSASEMNTRLRKIITHYQRDFKKRQVKMQQQAKKVEKREKLDAMFREREARKRETLQKWTRREETDFYRVVSTYGIEFDRVKGRYIWEKFRVMAKLEKKTDEQLTEYFISFYHMCLRVCRKIKEEAYPPTPIYIEAITEERASRCIARIDLLSKIREEIIVHQKMDQRVRLCKRSVDLPSWWVSGMHDKELLIGAAKHGLARTDHYILNDPALSFLDVVKALKAASDSHSNSPANFKMFGKDLEKKEIKTEKEEKEDKPGKKANKDKENGDDDDDENNDGDDDDTMNRAKLKAELKNDKSDVGSENGDIDSIKTEDNKDEDSCDTIVAEDTVIKTDTASLKTVKEEEEEQSDSAIVKKENHDSDSGGKTVKKEKENGEKQPVDCIVSVNVKVKVKKENDDEEGKSKDSANTNIVVKEEKKIKEEDQDLKDDPDEEVRRTLEDEESGMDLLSGVSQTLYSDWPKDRIIFHRLEQICYCVETGEWPFPPKMKNMHILGIDSGTNTPTRSLTPQTPKLEDEGSGREEKKPDKDFEVQVNQGDSLKMTFQRKPEKNKSELSEAEKNARIQAILAQNLAASQAGSSDDSQSDSVLSSQVSWPSPWPPNYPIISQSMPDSPFLNGSHMSEEELLLSRRMFEQGIFPGGDRRGRRGRKRKEEKMAEIAMAEALARRQTARLLASIEPDARVPVINLEDGSRLSGDEAPRKKDLDGWLDKHPGYIIDSREEELEEGEIIPDFQERRKGRKPKFDPAYLDVEKLTGEENVAVVNRLTGKKITGAKAPPLRYLADWLEQNPMWDVDPKWSDLVRAKGSLPKTLLQRVVTPSRRGRRARDSPISHSSLLAGGDPHQAAALAASIEAMNAAQLMAAGYGKLPLPFANMAGLGLNPMLGLLGFPGLAPGALPTDNLDGKSETPKKSSEEGDKSSKDDDSLPQSPFPLMFNPMIYNQALLASHGLTNFPSPSSLTGLGSSLINGHSKSEKDSSKSPKPHRKDSLDLSHAEDLSYKTKPPKVIENTTAAHSGGKNKLKVETVTAESDDMPCDLSMKPKSKEDKSKQKICNSDKLSRIVDTLKCRVNNMDDIKGDEKVSENRRSSLDAALNLKSNKSESTTPSDHSDISSKHDIANSPSHKSSSSTSSKSSSSSQNHAEPVPKIVQELLAAKHRKELKEREDMLIEKQKKLDLLLGKQNKLDKEMLVASTAAESALSAQGSSEDEMEENLNEPMEDEDS